MTDAIAEKQQQTLDAADVAEYLRNHPEFFQNRPDVLFDMALPHGQNQAASLLEKQAGVLRNRNTELRHKMNELVNVARDNDRLFEQIKTLGLSLLEVNTVPELASTLQQVLSKTFSLNHVGLFLYKACGEKGHFTQTSSNEIQAELGDLLRKDRIVCTTLRQKEMEFLFPGYDRSEGSALLIPLKFQMELGMLAIGSTDPNHFSSSMDTSFARYIGDILSRRLYFCLI